MRCRNDAALLPRVLTSLAAPRDVCITETIVFENASTDGSRAIVEAAGLQVVEVPEGAYRSSEILNRGASMATAPLVVYLNSDAGVYRFSMASRTFTKLADDFGAVVGVVDGRYLYGLGGPHPSYSGDGFCRLDLQTGERVERRVALPGMRVPSAL